MASKLSIAQEFHEACTSGNIEIVKSLIETNAITKDEIDEKATLYWTSEGGHIEIIKELLNFGANLNVPGEFGETALHIAAKSGHEEIVKLLIHNGANIEAKCVHLFTPLFSAIDYGQHEIALMLLKLGGNQNAKGLHDQNLLHFAAKSRFGHRIMKELIEKGVEINAVTNNKNETPLFYATRYNDQESIAILLDYGADVNISNIGGWTALYNATSMNCSGRKSTVAKLLAHGANVDGTGEIGREGANSTPLHHAFHNGSESEEIVRMLLMYGANVNIQNRQGETPLMMAAREGRLNIVQEMIKIKDVNLHLRDEFGLTALEQAFDKEHDQVVKVIAKELFAKNDIRYPVYPLKLLLCTSGNEKRMKKAANHERF